MFVWFRAVGGFRALRSVRMLGGGGVGAVWWLSAFGSLGFLLRVRFIASPGLGFWGFRAP